MSEVGLHNLEDSSKKSRRSDRNNNSRSSYKGLQVSDTPTHPQQQQQGETATTPPPPLPRRSRVRRNSAGDEISSILDHEALATNDNGLIVLNDEEPEYLNYYGNQHALHGPPGRHSGRVGEDRQGEVEVMMDEEDGVAPLGSMSMTTEASSSLNTTIVSKLEVSER